MRKVILTFVPSIIIVFLITSLVHSADSVVETPDVKVMINGRIMTYNDIPLSMAQRTLLPLREVLTHLGVENDDRHIVWDNDEKSVTIYKDDTKIYLKLGSKTAYVNDAPVTLDAAPIGYSKNQRVYVPARFVSQALGKKVVWDGSTKTVMIRDEGEFKSIQEILEKSVAAMNSVSKARIKSEMNMSLLKQGINMYFIVDMLTEVDKVNKKMSLNMDIPLFGKNLNFKSFYADNTAYEKNALTGEWEKKSLTEAEFNKALDDNIRAMIVNANETFYAGLVLGDSNNPDEILLKGNVYPKELFNKVNENTRIKNLELSQYYLEIVLDRTTYLVKRLYVDISGKYTDINKGDSQLKSQVTCIYSDIDGDFEIGVPEELQEGVVQ